MGLITTTEAAAALTDLSTAQTTELQTVIDAATSLMESYCCRILASRETCEEVAPGSTRIIRLQNYPVTSVARVATSATSVLSLTYSGAASRATATLTASGDPPFVAPTGLTIATVASGVTTPTPFLFSAYPTLSSLATAVGGVSGWTATVASGYSGFATTDLQADISVRSAKSATLPIYAYAADLDDWGFDPAHGEITLGAEYAHRYRHPDRTWGLGPRSGLVWVRYTAGYLTAPGDLKRICVGVVRGLFDGEQHSGLIKSEKVGSDSWEMFDTSKSGGVLAPFIGGLNRYRRIAFD